MKNFRYLWLFFVLIYRNIKWVLILLFAGGDRVWNIMDFKMYLSAKKAGLCLDESSIHRQLILDRIREPESSRIMRSFVSEDDVILELGANIGYYVLIESKLLSGKGYIYAVEPDPGNIASLKRNVELNGVKNIEIFPLAMSDTKGKAKLFKGAACNLHSLFNPSGSPNADYVEVETDTPDNFLSDKRPVTFIRMDIEGYEVVILQNMPKTLNSPHLKKLFVEIHPQRTNISQMQDLLRLLKNSGFEIKYAVSRDKFIRWVLKQTLVETMSLDALIADPRLTQAKVGFQLFLLRK